MDELLCVIELLIVTSPQHITDKSVKVQEYPLLFKTLTPSDATILSDNTLSCPLLSIRLAEGT